MSKKLSTVTGNAEQAVAFLALARAAVEGGEKILNLNLKQVKANLEDSSEALDTLLSTTDPQAYTAFALAQSRQNFGRMIAHFTELTNVTTSTQASLALLLGASLQSARAE